MPINEFFNTSSFMVVPLEKEPAIEPDEFFTVHLFIYDALSMQDASGISAKYYLKKGRDKSYLNSNNFTLTKVGTKTWSLEGQISSVDWDDNQVFGMEAEISFSTAQGYTSTVYVDKLIVGD